MGKGKKAGDKGGKKPHKNKPTSKKYARYSIEGSVAVRKHHCPRCGPGIFLAISDNRRHCGKCHYTEFEKK